MSNIKILSQSYCTGCSLCESVCPHKAITMQPNCEGFLFPEVNNSCENCGLCVSLCPILSQMYGLNKEAILALAVQCQDEVRFNSSSGGVFKTIAEFAIENDGIVCGAAFNKKQDELKHIIVNQKKDVGVILKSKYLQSDTRFIFEKIKKLLEQKKFTVFSGCPCQVASLKQYLRKDYDNLLTIDILCHGVPSPLAYKYYLKEKNKNNKEIKRVDFRDKTAGWGKSILIEYEDGSIEKDLYNCAYIKAFSSGMNMRESCYHCPWARIRRAGDISLGDFWGIEKIKTEFNDKKGTSLVLCNTKKGVNYINNLKRLFLLYQEMSSQDALTISKGINGALYRPVSPNRMRHCFFSHIKKEGFFNSTRYAEQAIMDVGIVGWWMESNHSNYGSTLTDYALGKHLESMGLSVAFISPPNYDRELVGNFNKRYNYRMTAKYAYENMKENNKYINTFLVASDVLWYYKAMIARGYTYMLDFADEQKKKIAYAASFGKTDNFFPEDEIPRVKYLLSRFDHISMREEEGVTVLKDRFELSSNRVLDPVFLCNMSYWEDIIENARLKVEGKFLFAYLMDPTDQKAKDIQLFAAKLGLKFLCIPDRQFNYEKKVEILKEYGVIENASIEDYLYCFKNASFVISDSFHGLCFSIIFRKPFYSLINKARGSTRFENLTNLFGLQKRIIENTHELDKFSIQDTELDYLSVEGLIDAEIVSSKSWLNNGLNSPKKNLSIDDKTILGNELYLRKKERQNAINNHL